MRVPPLVCFTMTLDLAGVRWLRIVSTSVGAIVVRMAITLAIVAGYAFSLGVQARGQPDQQLISAFANRFAPMAGPVFLALCTLFGAWRVARAGTAPVLHGVLIGFVTAIASLLPGWPLDLRAAAGFAAVLAAGWLGGMVGRRRFARGVAGRE